MNRLTNVVQLTNAATTASAWYSYDAAGRLWKKGYGNGDVVTHGYDTESRLLSLGITNNTSPVWWYRYGWDNGGNRKGSVNSIVLFSLGKGSVNSIVLFSLGGASRIGPTARAQRPGGLPQDRRYPAVALRPITPGPPGRGSSRG